MKAEESQSTARTWLTKALKVSYTGSYILNRKSQLENVLKKDPNDKHWRRKKTSRIVHFCFSILVDLCLGLFLTGLLHHELRPRRLSDNALLCTDLVVSNLRRCLNRKCHKSNLLMHEMSLPWKLRLGPKKLF